MGLSLKGVVRLGSQWIFLGGEFVKKEDAVISVYDHGFLYGDGVFEGIRVYSGNVFRLDAHLKRLFESAQSIMLQVPYSKEELTQLIVETIRKNQLRQCIYPCRYLKRKRKSWIGPFLLSKT